MIHPLIPRPRSLARYSHVLSLVGEGVDVVQAEPELGVDVAEAVLVLVPPAVKLDAAVDPTLNRRPRWRKSGKVGSGRVESGDGWSEVG